ncbi:hypothetical protein G8759_32215 [Spirosoma aureum]|uniref:Caspase family protein n=1 Tax=Spirosoma aureum TaxID=2692134 RepID=A0A6G9AWX7_9BACT|nr:caspase family protein [Spirosoma aureum]QIP16972.1 hypothetical protein G8759_32215 [Spirosoma aureum]
MFPNRHAYLLGVQDYQDSKIPKLSTPINDINRLALILKERYNFTVTCIPNPTADQFRNVFNEDLKSLPTDAQVVIYYAGHGMTAQEYNLNQSDTEQGYLLPVDVVSNDNGEAPDLAISMEEIAHDLAELPFSQLLLILDCCYAGMFQQAAMRFTPQITLKRSDSKILELETPTASGSSTERAIAGSRVSRQVNKEEFNAFIGYKARQIFTSTAYDQKAKDSYMNVTLENGNSPFADKLCDALSSDQETVDSNDDIITLFELQNYMQPRLDPFQQVCCIFPFSGHDGGEFVFLNKYSKQLTTDKRRNPFMGLLDYESSDAPYYFGRRTVIDELTPLVLNNPFVVVVGASGSGKSSLVKAGILPKIESEPHLKVIRPGKNPMEGLANFSAHPEQFLVIDQMEELATQTNIYEQDKLLKNFFQEAFKLIDTQQVRGIIGTLRIEFIKPIKTAVEAIRPGFWQQYLVPTFSIEDLNDIILCPAELVKVFFQPEREVVGKIINDFRLYPNALPLLSLALDDLFSSTFRIDRTIRLADYKGIEAVLQKKEHVLKEIKTTDLELDQHDIDEFRKNLMIRFVSYQNGTYVRRRIPTINGELSFGQKYDQLAKRLINALAENRLVERIEPKLDSSSDAVKQEGHIELAHEALIFSWDEFRTSLLELGSDSLIRHNKLADDTTLYNPADPEPSLWTNSQMLALLSKADRSIDTMDFILGKYILRPILRRFGKTVRPPWTYFLIFEPFESVFGTINWLLTAEQNFLRASYKAAVGRRFGAVKTTLIAFSFLYVAQLMLSIYIGRRYEMNNQEKEMIRKTKDLKEKLEENTKDDINDKMKSAEALTYINAYAEALRKYSELDHFLADNTLLQKDSIRAKRAEISQKVKQTRSRQTAFNAITQLIKKADSLSQWPLLHPTSEMAESCLHNTYFKMAADRYVEASQYLNANKMLFRDKFFSQTWNELNRQTQNGLNISTIELKNLQRICLDVSAGFNLVNANTGNYTQQHSKYKKISQAIDDYLKQKKPKPKRN